MNPIKQFKDDWGKSTTGEKVKWVIIALVLPLTCIWFVIYETNLFRANHNYLHIWLATGTIPLLLILTRISIKPKGKL